MQQNHPRVRIINEQLLSDNWYTLKKIYVLAAAS
ncbi:Uncharacterised protein [Pantoea agglomerans]|uniref:Uncharacterized protein n=1 Tax=Enterobacter agglomerans TaxID=549 RepID=A0A379AG54_ENTAG|nr:Uncharacterised protein [Pantoea agglomerans]